MARAGILGILAVLASVAVVWANPEAHIATGHLLDPATGVIGGKTAVVVYPARRGHGDLADLLPPADYRSLLVPIDNQDEELSYPCGQWFQPPPGRYRVSVVGPWQMSSYSALLAYKGLPFKGSGLPAVVEVEEAGRVTLPPDMLKSEPLVLRLLHIGPYFEHGHTRRELVRRRGVAAIGEGVMMPAGPTVAGLWDPREHRYVSMSRSFDVVARETVLAPLERPVGTSHVIVQLGRHSIASKLEDLDVDVSLESADVVLHPDLKVPTAGHIYAIWYAVPPGEVILSADSPASSLSPHTLKLEAGRIERFVGKLAPRQQPGEIPDWMRSE